MKRWCWNCEKDTKHITKHVKYGGDDDIPNIMYTREFYCVKCGEGYYLKWYFRSTILRKMNKKRRIRYGKQKN